MDKRRGRAHLFQQTLAPADSLAYLKTIPSTLVVTENIIGRQVEFKDVARFVCEPAENIFRRK